MEQWLIWVLAGCLLIVSELLIPGGVVVFLGIAGLMVGGAIKLGYLNSFSSIIFAFFFSSLFLLIFVRAFFMKYFAGDTTIHNVDEQKDAQGSIVEVVEDILPYKEGRVNFRGTAWQARSEEEIVIGSKAIIIRIEGNIIIVKSI